ncbi:hypothetical protein VTL71DRAFT_6051, partial [Oculimacula yallundae]
MPMQDRSQRSKEAARASPFLRQGQGFLLTFPRTQAPQAPAQENGRPDKASKYFFEKPPGCRQTILYCHMVDPDTMQYLRGLLRSIMGRDQL